MGMKFDMGATTLGTLTKQTQGSHEDLGSLVKQLVTSVTPLEGRFNGSGKAAFDKFKTNADVIAADLNSSLARILGGQSGMNTAFLTGDQEMATNANQANASAPYSAAQFGAQR